MSGATDGATDEAMGMTPVIEPELDRPRVHQVGRRPARSVELQKLCDDSAADLLAWRDGDRAALERMVHRLTPMLWHTVRAYRLDDGAAEDVVQSTWLTFVRRGDTITDPQAVVRWLTVTARREAWHVLRDAGRTQAQEDDVLDLRADPGPSVEEQVARDARDAALWAAVGRLSDRCQRLLRVVAFSDRPDYAELSDRLGMPMGSIGPTRGRCLDKLRALLGSTADDWRTT
jgi:RNA polymerase sigma factor (sigma-70 family)